MRKIVAVILVVTLCLCMSASVCAETESKRIDGIILVEGIEGNDWYWQETADSITAICSNELGEYYVSFLYKNEPNKVY